MDLTAPLVARALLARADALERELQGADDGMHWARRFLAVEWRALAAEVG